MRKLIFIFIALIPVVASSQQNNWTKEFSNDYAFVKNMGQYDGRNWQSANKVEYAVKQGGWYTFFSKKGLTYRIDKLDRHPDRKKGDHHIPKRIHMSELVDVFFIGANNNVEIIAEDKTNYYYSFAIKNKETKEVYNKNNVDGYKKITYKNLYNKIDIEYIIHSQEGIKYNIILHPGADPSQIKMQYKTSHTNYKNENVVINLNQQGELELNGSLAQIIEYKPQSFYASNNLPIGSRYSFSGNILTFNIDNYDNTQKVVIDPWVVSPAFNAGDFTREVETDGSGNIYVIGGEIPMELRKYNSAGVLQWTYSTPWDTVDGDWLGTLATDNLGTSYITQGVGAEIERVSTAGAMAWHANGPGFPTSYEYWSITFNCDNTKLIVGGTELGFGIPLPSFAKIFEIDLSNGSTTNNLTVSSQGGSNPIEVRSIAPTKNSKYVYLTHLDVGLVNQNLTACSAAPDFEVSNTEELAYKCERYLSASQNGGGLKALVANDNYFYTHKGDQILQWDVTNGALLNTVNLPSGNASHGTILGLPNFVVSCSGLDVDVNGNVYAGTMNSVVKFDANLNILSTAPTTGGFTVYDVSVNSNGEVLAVGALLDNSTSTGRGGRIESLNMTAGAQYATVCCDPNFCPVDPLCTTDAPVNLNPNTAGGTWSSVPVTAGLNIGTGVFSPSVAGVGTYVVTYTLACGSNSITISVGDCSAMSVCVESNGDLTVTGGTGPYAWDEWTTTTFTPSTSAECTTCGGTWFPGIPPLVPPSCSEDPCSLTGWSNFASGVTVTPPIGADSVRVTDAFGNNLEIYNIGSLSSCSTTCDATITAAEPFCINAAAVNLTAAQTGGTWSGTGITNASAGTFNPTTAGIGNHTITYTLGCGDVDTETIVVNASDDASFTYPSGSYCLADPNPTPSITGTMGGTFTIDGSGVINSSTGVVNLTGSGLGSYTVTYTTAGSCPDTNTFDITITNSTDATITQAGPFCQNATAVNLTAVSSGGNWTGTGITNATLGTFNPATAGAGSHIITYTITGSCGSVDTMTIVVNAIDNAAFTYSSNTFCLTDPNPSPTITGLTGGIFTINNGGVINSGTGAINLTSSGTGAFTVTYTTNGFCPNTQTFNLNINNCSSPLPVANFSASQTNICVGACISFTDMSISSAVGGITTWAWTFTGAVTTSSSVQNPTNICYSTAGTYQVVLTVTDANGSDTETKTSYITVTSCTPPTVGFTISDTVICAGTCISFTDTSTGATSWQWTFENGNPPSSVDQNPTSVCYSLSGTHEIKLIASNAFGTDSLTQYVTVLQPQQVFAGNDTIILLNQSVNLNATGIVNGTYTWSPPLDLTCTTCPNPTATPEETVTYTIIGSDTNGCKTTDNITIIVDFENVIFVPNIFSPNGDGINDLLFVRGKGVANLKFFVYDRWGEKVFETTSLDVGWDGTFRGKDMNKAVFVYYLEATFIDGKEVTQKGDITLVK